MEDCEDWLVQKTHNAVNEKDLYEAKCWLITAKCLYPLNFKVQVCLTFCIKDTSPILHRGVETTLGCFYTGRFCVANFSSCSPAA